jgi:cobalt/nickel transport protein
MKMLRKLRNPILAIAGAALLFGITPAYAHFQMIIPSDDMVSSPAERQIRFEIKFWHPFEGQGMSMDTPVQFGVRTGGKNIDLRKSLQPHPFQDNSGKNRDGFQATYTVTRPGDYIFYIEPKPYWEPAEETYIVHYAKVIVNGLGLEEGWDDAVGLKTEIIPLTRPYGLYTNNVFQGIVKLYGKPAPFTKVEVEYYNEDGKLKAPDDPMITQVVKTDANGVFTYAMPRAGWWGFAALHHDKKKMMHDGKEYPVEIGALIWVKTHDMPQ